MLAPDYPDGGYHASTLRPAPPPPCAIPAIEPLFGSGALDPAQVVAVPGKAQGHGCVNDRTCAHAVQALSRMLARRPDEAPEAVAARIAMVMSGGTKGGLSPHALVPAVGAGAARKG
jgi:cyanuric acid amidohydrolase